MTPEEKIDKGIDDMRCRMANTLRDEIKSLYENAALDDEAFDELLAEISDLIERYQGIL